VLFYLDRADMLSGAAKLPRTISEYFRQHVYVTPSGLFSHRYRRTHRILMSDLSRSRVVKDDPNRMAHSLSAPRRRTARPQHPLAVQLRLDGFE